MCILDNVNNVDYCTKCGDDWDYCGDCGEEHAVNRSVLVDGVCPHCKYSVKLSKEFGEIAQKMDVRFCEDLRVQFMAANENEREEIKEKFKVIHSRFEKLSEALNKVGLKCRFDSRLCKAYVNNGKGILYDIVRTMANCKFLYDYCDWNTLRTLCHRSSERESTIRERLRLIRPGELSEMPWNKDVTPEQFRESGAYTRAIDVSTVAESLYGSMNPHSYKSTSKSPGIHVMPRSCMGTVCTRPYTVRTMKTDECNIRVCQQKINL